MSVDTSKVTSFIDQIVAEKTFSLDAVEKVKELRDSVNQLVEEIRRKEDEIMTLNTYNNGLQKQINDLTDQLRPILVREETVSKREKEINEKEHEYRAATKIREEMHWMFEMIFRNTSIRKDFVRGHAGVDASGYMHTATTCDSEDISEK